MELKKVKGFFMIEPFLIGYNGHLFNYAKSIQDAINNKIYNFKIFVSKDCESVIFDNINAVSIFDSIPSNKHFSTIFGRLFYSVFIFNKHLYRGLRKISKNYDLNNKIIFFGTIQHIHLYGLFFWLFFLKKDNKPLKIILTLRLSIFRYDKKRWALSYFWYLIGLNLIKTIKNKYNIFLITDSEKLVAEFANVTRQKITLLPIPHTHKFQIKNLLNQKLIISSLGGARKNKGVDLIIDSIIALSCDNIFNDITFIIQSNCHENDNYMKSKINLLRSYKFDNVEILDSALSEDDYYKIFNITDIVLIPYDLGIYYANTSGIFTEATSMGKPVIVTRGTWMSDNLSNNCGLLINNRDSDDLVLKIKSLVLNYNEYKIASELNAKNWNNYHNPNNFINELLKIGL